MRKNQSQCSEKENEIDKRERNRVKVKDIEKETQRDKCIERQKKHRKTEKTLGDIERTKLINRKKHRRKNIKEMPKEKETERK